MPVAEGDVGITEYLGSHHPFRAIVKQSIDDFVVNEVLLSGEVAQLTVLARSGPEPSRRDAQPRVAPSEPSASLDINALPFQALDLLMPDANPTASSILQKALEAREKNITLPPCPDKKKRTEIHAWVRENLLSFISDTVDVADAKAVRVRRKDACRPWKRRRTNNGERVTGRNEDAIQEGTYDPREARESREHLDANSSLHVRRDAYVSFVLWKRNKDTTEALTTLSHILRVPVEAFSYAGTKDKRAVTTQRIHIRGISESRFARANRILQQRGKGHRPMAIGNVQLVPKGGRRALGLGDLKGNRFTLALRDLEVDNEDGGMSMKNILAAAESVKKRGFINYFGLQRFGSGVSATHETGFAFFRGDFEDVCRRILLPLKIEDGEGMRPERKLFVEAMERFARKEITAKELLPQLPQWMHIESALVKSFVDEEQRGITKYDYKKAFGKLPRNLRKMYGHAVQSFLWNVMASERIRSHPPNADERMHAIAGDLVRVQQTTEREFNFGTPVRIVTEEEENAKSVSVYEVLIPVVGSGVPIPESGYGAMARKIVEEEKVDMKAKFSSEYGMKGTYRPLLAMPKDMTTEIRAYTDKQKALIPCPVRHLSTTEGNSHGSQEQPGAFNTGVETGTSDMVNRPDPMNCVRSIAEMHSELVEAARKSSVKDTGGTPVLLATNKGSTGKESEPASQGNVAGKSSKDGDGFEAGEAATEVEGDPVAKTDINGTVLERKALIVSFTLGCAEYATMLVRELTRRDSSTAGQKALQDEVTNGEHKSLTK